MMRNILLTLFGFCCVICTNSRLIDSVKERTIPTDTKTVSSPPLRLTRQIDVSREEDTLPEISEEDRVRSDEYVKSLKKKGGPFYKPRLESKHSRLPRGSGERVDKTTKNSTSIPSTHAPAAHPRPKAKPVLVKKPIPKYNEMDYDEDFQMKVNRSPVKIIDSGEHEDEDFNLNDYEFDVNHDEFVGRGKPLEPRIKHVKELRENVEPSRPEPKPATVTDVRIKTKANLHKISPKKERSAENYKKAGEKEDYYDETNSSAKAKTTEKQREVEDEFNEESDDSKEYDTKASSGRSIRSPKKMNIIAEKYGEKRGMSNILSILPMFPQLPGKARRFEYNLGNDPSFSWSVKVHKD